jgi:hypothetical protein
MACIGMVPTPPRQDLRSNWSFGLTDFNRGAIRATCQAAGERPISSPPRVGSSRLRAAPSPAGDWPPPPRQAREAPDSRRPAVAGSAFGRRAQFTIATPCFAVWPLSKTLPALARRSREAGHGAEPLNYLVRGANPAPRRRFPFPSVPLRVAGSDGGQAFAPGHVAGRPQSHALPRSRLCARPARTARSGGRGTLGRNLPGRGLR